MKYAVKSELEAKSHIHLQTFIDFLKNISNKNSGLSVSKLILTREEEMREDARNI